MMVTTYKDAGVDIESGEALVRRIRRDARSTFTRNVLADIGAFGAFYRADFNGIRKPVLVTSVDGVGTKLKIAFAMNRHDTVGQDLVNHCVNDILACGARPLYFLDYFAMGKLSPSVGAQVITGLVRACKENGCSLVGGETAEMPGFYSEGEYDIAGTIVGVVDERRIIDGRSVRRGDVLLALPSTGLHTNGFSLVRAVLLKRFRLDEYVPELQATLGETLLTVHRSYLKPIHPLLSTFRIHALSHITGGGIEGNTLRVIPKGLRLSMDWSAWDRPAIFRLVQEIGAVPEDDMRRTFNLGVGMILVLPPSDVDRVVKVLRRRRENPFVIGEIVRGRTQGGN